MAIAGGILLGVGLILFFTGNILILKTGYQKLGWIAFIPGVMLFSKVDVGKGKFVVPIGFALVVCGLILLVMGLK